jgi:hypothetical protein
MNLPSEVSPFSNHVPAMKGIFSLVGATLCMPQEIATMMNAANNN